MIFRTLRWMWVAVSVVALVLPFSRGALAQTCANGGPCDFNCPSDSVTGTPTCGAVCTPTPGVYSGGGSGTEADPYGIRTPMDLVTLSKDPAHWDKVFCQDRDIDMAATVCQPITPIGSLEKPFTGCYSGGGYRIRNLQVVSAGLSETDGTGMFGVVGSTGTVDRQGVVVDVLLDNPTVIGSTSDVGSLVGALVWGCVYSCGSMGGEVVNGAQVDRTHTGGLIGQTCPGTLVRESFSRTLVAGADFVGGLVGQNAGKIEYCYAESKVIQSGDWPDLSRDLFLVCLGGLVGSNDGGTIRGCYANAPQFVSQGNPPAGITTLVGGLVGQWVLPAGTPFFTAPYNYSRHCTPGLDRTKANNAVGSPDPDTTAWTAGVAESRGDSSMVKRSTYVGWDFENIWFIVEGADTPKLRGL